MNCDVSWKFSAPLKLVDVNRILKEAGPYAKCVRFSIDGKVYTAVNSKKVDVLPDPGVATNAPGIKYVNPTDGFALTENAKTVRADNGKPVIVGSMLYKDTPWVLYVGDRTHDIVDRVKVTVEVFK